ncbi:unnamed protein product, partial [Musa acuminata subsp. burmannicoides]
LVKHLYIPLPSFPFRSLHRCIPLFSSPHSRLRLVQVGNRSIGDGTPDPSASGIRSDLHWSRRHASPLASSEFENTWRKGSSLIGFRYLNDCMIIFGSRHSHSYTVVFFSDFLTKGFFVCNCFRSLQVLFFPMTSVGFDVYLPKLTSRAFDWITIWYLDGVVHFFG